MNRHVELKMETKTWFLFSFPYCPYLLPPETRYFAKSDTQLYNPALKEIVETLVESPEPKSIHVFSVLCWEKGQGMAHVSVSISSLIFFK